MILAAFEVIAALVIMGVLWWALQQLLALASPYIGEPFLTIIRIVVVIIMVAIILWACYQLIVLLGGASGGGHLPRLVE